MSTGSVLVIDDRPDVVGFIGAVLRARGIAAVGAGSAARGLALARTGAYDLVILDLFAGGTAALRALRTTLPDQPVLVLARRSDAGTRARCLELGASDCLIRPFASAELIARVRIQLRRPRAARRSDEPHDGVRPRTTAPGRARGR